MSKESISRLFYNSRFYVLISSFLLSIVVVSALRLSIMNDQLYIIRTEQVFGLIGILYWYAALIISPLGYVIGKEKLQALEFARRAIGVSAAYFALLHASVALYGQLGGIHGIVLLPTIFLYSLCAGGIALFILLIMALTSFDRVITYMTFTRWKWLHRLVYVGGVLAVLHIWSIGTHLEYDWVRLTAFVGLSLLAVLEAYRTLTLLSRKYNLLKDTGEFIVFHTLASLILIGLILSIPSLVPSYHMSQHVESHTTDAAQHSSHFQ
jgi:DMSO/TMAO reductase YedYZ heme-binding membrane subunit